MQNYDNVNLTKAEDSKPMATEEAVANVLFNQTAAEVFLEQNYMFRRNVLRGQVEYRKLEENDKDFRPLTQRALNSIILASKHILGEELDIAHDMHGNECLPLFIGDQGCGKKYVYTTISSKGTETILSRPLQSLE